ncbi:hypothetical protein ACFX2I_043004 [Malus domestica]
MSTNDPGLKKRKHLRIDQYLITYILIKADSPSSKQNILQEKNADPSFSDYVLTVISGISTTAPPIPR